MIGGLLDRGASRCVSMRGQRDSKGRVFEAACGGSENTDEFHVRLETRVEQVAFVEFDTNCNEETSVLHAVKRRTLRRKTRIRVRLGDFPKRCES